MLSEHYCIFLKKTSLSELMELPPTGEHNLLPIIYLHIELSAYHVLHRISCACYETSLNICSEVFV